MWKLLIALLVAYAGWRLWRDAFGFPTTTKKKKHSAPRESEQAAAAAQLLGVPPGADARAIRAAHRRLMAEAHPDVGGTPERAGALNAARDLLLRRQG